MKRDIARILRSQLRYYERKLKKAESRASRTLTFEDVLFCSPRYIRVLRFDLEVVLLRRKRDRSIRTLKEFHSERF